MSEFDDIDPEYLSQIRADLEFDKIIKLNYPRYYAKNKIDKGHFVEGMVTLITESFLNDSVLATNCFIEAVDEVMDMEFTEDETLASRIVARQIIDRRKELANGQA